jgi:hypothetical protein
MTASNFERGGNMKKGIRIIERMLGVDKRAEEAAKPADDPRWAAPIVRRMISANWSIEEFVDGNLRLRPITTSDFDIGDCRLKARLGDA